METYTGDSLSSKRKFDSGMDLSGLTTDQLKELKIEVDGENDSIRQQQEHYKRDYVDLGIKGDWDWKIRAERARKELGKLSQRICLELGRHRDRKKQQMRESLPRVDKQMIQLLANEVSRLSGRPPHRVLREANEEAHQILGIEL